MPKGNFNWARTFDTAHGQVLFYYSIEAEGKFGAIVFRSIFQTEDYTAEMKETLDFKVELSKDRQREEARNIFNQRATLDNAAEYAEKFQGTQLFSGEETCNSKH